MMGATNLISSIHREDAVMIDKYIIKPVYIRGELAGVLISGPRIRNIYLPLSGGVKIEKLSKKVRQYLKQKYGIQV